jgi:hypothetical protein
MSLNSLKYSLFLEEILDIEWLHFSKDDENISCYNDCV